MSLPDLPNLAKKLTFLQKVPQNKLQKYTMDLRDFSKLGRKLGKLIKVVNSD